MSNLPSQRYSGTFFPVKTVKLYFDSENTVERHYELISDLVVISRNSQKTRSSLETQLLLTASSSSETVPSISGHNDSSDDVALMKMTIIQVNK